jgi:polyisoprenoid-binding protein YceI
MTINSNSYKIKCMKNIVLCSAIFILGLNLSAQKYSSKNGFVGFYGHTPVEDIKADNNQVASIIDIATGDIVTKINIKSFHFDRALMEEHFNENYMESETYSKATFAGKIVNISDVKADKPGIYKVTVNGQMTMHGVTNPFSTEGTMEVTAEGVVAKAKFSVKPEDYGIVIPSLVREKIANSMEVTLNIKYSPVNS